MGDRIGSPAEPRRSVREPGLMGVSFSLLLQLPVERGERRTAGADSQTRRAGEETTAAASSHRKG